MNCVWKPSLPCPPSSHHMNHSFCFYFCHGPHSFCILYIMLTLMLKSVAFCTLLPSTAARRKLNCAQTKTNVIENRDLCLWKTLRSVNSYSTEWKCLQITSEVKPTLPFLTICKIYLLSQLLNTDCCDFITGLQPLFRHLIQHPNTIYTVHAHMANEFTRKRP